jgi:DNA adenine methylase
VCSTSGRRATTQGHLPGRRLAFFVRCRQSSPAAATRSPRLPPPHPPGHERAGRAWLTAVEGLPEVHARLKRVVVLNRPALDVIRQQDGPDTLFYLDPPYLHETRAATDAYAHEMSDADHAKLLVALSHVEGKFLLSGYDSEMYRKAERVYGWNRHTSDLPNHAAGGGEKRRMTEVLWTNF